jgi:AcrR family transcriptional regulator
MKHPLQRSVRKRIEIMRSASAVFRRRGYHGASVEQIASALNMTKGNLYYYFKNKEEILFMCHDYALDVIQEHVVEVERSPLTVDQKVHEIIRGFVHLFIDVLHGTAWTLELDALSPELFQKIVAKRDRVDRAFRRLLRLGMDEGVFAPGDPKLLTFAIMGAINWIPLWFKASGNAKADDVAAAFADYLVAGLVTPGRRTKVPSAGVPTPRLIALASAGFRKSASRPTRGSD